MVRPFNPVAALKSEHKAILDELNLLEQDLRVLGRDGEINHPKRWQNLRNGMRFVVEQVRLHARQEDEALFPMLQNFPELSPAWRVMIEQDRYLHDAFGRLDAMWQETDDKHNQGLFIPVAEIPFLVKSSLELTEVLRRHMAFEEVSIFDFAEERLTDEQKSEVAYRMAEIRCQPAAPIHQPLSA